MSYDYRNDPRIQEAAKKYDYLLVKSYDHFLADQSSLPILFYDSELLHSFVTGGHFSDASEVESNFLWFAFDIGLFMDQSHSYNYASEEDMIDAAKGFIIKLFDLFSQKLIQSYPNDLDTVMNWARQWRDVTVDILIEMFQAHPFTVDIFGDGYKDNLWLLESCIFVTNNIYADFYEKHSPKNQNPYSNIILYNFWADEYWSLKQRWVKDTAKSKDDAELNDLLQNRLLFKNRFRQMIQDFTKGTKREALGTDQTSSLQHFFQDLFSDYTKLLRLNKIQEPSVLSTAAHYWMDITMRLVNDVLTIEKEKVRLSHYSPGDIVHPYIFLSPDHWKWDLLIEAQSKSNKIVEYVCRTYLDELESGQLQYPWSSDIVKLNIDFIGLHKIMNGRYFSNISVELFEDYIMSADFSELENRILGEIRDGNRGALHYLVKSIGQHNEQWFIKAISTLRKSNGGSYLDKRDFISTVQDSRKNIQSFICVLKNNNVSLPPPPSE